MSQLQMIFSEFQRDIQARVQQETSLRDLASHVEPRELLLRSKLQEWQEKQQAVTSHAEEDFQQRHHENTSSFDQQLAAAHRQHESMNSTIELDAARALREVEDQRDDSAWVVQSVLDDSGEDSPRRTFERFKTLAQKSQDDQVAELQTLDQAIAKFFGSKVELGGGVIEFDRPPASREAAAERFTEAMARSRLYASQLKLMILPVFLKGLRSLGAIVVFGIAFGVTLYKTVQPELFSFHGEENSQAWIIACGVIGLVAGVLLTLVLYTLMSMRQSGLLSQILNARDEARWAQHHWTRITKEQISKQQKDVDLQQRKMASDREASLMRYQKAHSDRLESIETHKLQRIKEERLRYAEEYSGLVAQKRESLETLRIHHQQNLEQIKLDWTARIQSLSRELQQLVEERENSIENFQLKLNTGWNDGLSRFEAALQDLRSVDQSQFPSWESLALPGWKPAVEIPGDTRIGEFLVDLRQWDGAVSSNPELHPHEMLQQVPYALNFPEATSVLFKSPDAESREQAIRGLQCLMLRLLTQVPPGKLRFTIIDPVGLGESFSGFMHLTDYDELMVTSRIWTESNQIEARLADLTEHMENVLQKYLRNEFQTIEEYNESAGEVAEPYHVLVISDFPAKFSEIAARRLVSIVNSGPRCGVYTLMNIDPRKQLPNNISLDDIQSRMSKFIWDKGAFRVPDSALPEWPIIIDTPPSPEVFTKIVKQVGEASKDARKVEVSFSRITPDADEIWSKDSRSELVIPVGRAGATKLQQMRLGKGTSQHMLVAGKTGSGKSTFLHILITNLSLYYSPNEVNFFLIDFKKGVEFKDYATHQLPHANVIAIESDREFGVSALQRLGEILQHRGELFRQHGVQDIAGYRNATNLQLPRILLVVDEFQEFFVEDDKISHQAALLLDRLVRQGRAFGIHVVLGSQTLGGAYSLARSTLGQVAVRVALQCSESDAHLILSEENSAARLLTRPGEAIYNDANGMVEGNHPFQIAWLSDLERESALNEMQQRLSGAGIAQQSTLVFEGNIPSDLSRNRDLLLSIADFTKRTASVHTPTIWLGDAVEIAPATSITFHRQSGGNLLIVGQDASAALGVMSAAFIALAAAVSPNEEANTLFVLDGSHEGTAEAESWKNLTQKLPFHSQQIPQAEVAPFLQAVTTELQRRLDENDAQAPSMFIFVYHVARFRDLRKADDDFGMSGFGMGQAEKPPQPGKLFADLLSQGPSVGIHLIVWCDSYNNLDRWFSRQSMREMELRIAFQMNASDSSNFIDSPAASRLGTHRAILHREETGHSEKLRPYGPPSEDWLNRIARIMSGEAESQQVLNEQPAENSAKVAEAASEQKNQDDHLADLDLEEFTIQ
ncbi:FtsK/SpoIIIE domain-containing protein [Planctomicrobium sp. SH668]|uniref:FtsK/SpoIIIE domain-containing protein n=1 Tax=Planctomicrobium sp. SH668 TaxID=3448126 RepID=UPI003F5B3931